MLKTVAGFALTPALLALVAFCIVGFTGWYVWNSSSNIDQALKSLESLPFDAKAKKIVAVGDLVCDPNDPYRLIKNLGYCQDEATYQIANKLNPDAVLILGDLQYNDGALDKFNDRYEKTWGQLKSITYPVPGNHEYGTKAAAGYFSYFNGSEASGKAGESGKGYYSFDLGGWHFIALNSNCASVGGCGSGSPQAEWLNQDLQNNRLVCVAAYWHHPRFTSGSYSTDQVSRSLSAEFWNILTQHKADVVLNGHDHIYERFAPQAASAEPKPDGVRQFTVGTGGKALYNKKAVTPNSEVVIDDSFGILIMELYSKAYRWQFLSAEGKILDSGYQQCSGTS
jgi:3',5'-cyclic AMP phosphodiesterase CpdA